MNPALSRPTFKPVLFTFSYRYQQTKVSVFAKFLAEDSDSGRREYFPSRGFELDVTELLIGRGLRVSDPRIASLRGNILQGMSPGRAEVQVKTSCRPVLT